MQQDDHDTYEGERIEKEIVLGLIVSSARTVLVCRRHESDVWMLPGGNIEPDEKPCDAMCREIEEELGRQVVCTRDHRLLDTTAPGPHGIYRYCLYAMRYDELLPDLAIVSHPEFVEAKRVSLDRMHELALTSACRVLFVQIDIAAVVERLADYEQL